MVTIDLNVDRQWEALFRRVEAGEILRITRGGKDVAVIQPADVVADDEAYLNMLADMGIRQIAANFPPNEYAEWDKAGKNNGTR